MSVFQSTLRRTERRALFNVTTKLNWISIHAPTNGATFLSPFFQVFYKISIHAPTNGATVFRIPLVIVIIISIHAPTNGATDKAKPVWIARKISIHAPTNGATHYWCEIFHYFLFQSTLRRTERHFLWFYTQYNCLFQSTLRRTERRQKFGAGFNSNYISIHAPTNGATLWYV